MFGRKKKPVPKWLLQLFRDGNKYWYSWLPLNEKGKLTLVQAKKHDYFISCFFEDMPHNANADLDFTGDYFCLEKMSIEELRTDLKFTDSGELVGELLESISYDGLWAEKTVRELMDGTWSVENDERLAREKETSEV